MPVFLPAEADSGMNRGIYSTANGMITAQRALDVITNNLANVSTNGYKRDGVAFNDALEREMAVDGREIGKLGTGATLQPTFTSFDQGSLTETGNPLDLALQGEDGMFAVQVGNQTRYTRDGSFGIDANRNLVTKDGHQVLDSQSRPISLDPGTISIQPDGTVQVNGEAKAKIGVFAADSFTKIGGNLFIAGGNVKDAERTTIKSGAIEGSNVNAVDSMVQMIQLNRLFEMSQKSIAQQDDLTQKLIQSLQER